MKRPGAHEDERYLCFEPAGHLCPESVILDRYELLAFAVLCNNALEVAVACQLRNAPGHAKQRFESLQQQQLLLHRVCFLLPLQDRRKRLLCRCLSIGSRDCHKLGAP